MTEAHLQIAEETGAIVAHVGDTWWDYQYSYPQLEMYAEDGEHASPSGSDFAAKMIETAISDDLFRKSLLEQRDSR